MWSVSAGGIVRSSCTKSHPAGSLSSSQPGGPPFWASPLASGLICKNTVVIETTLHLESRKLKKGTYFYKIGLLNFCTLSKRLCMSFQYSCVYTWTVIVFSFPAMRPRIYLDTIQQCCGGSASHCWGLGSGFLLADPNPVPHSDANL